MKPHHRASLLIGCLVLLVLYLPGGVSLVGAWPKRPDLSTVPTLNSDAVASFAASSEGLPDLHAPRGYGAPVTLDQLSLERAGDTYLGGQ